MKIAIIGARGIPASYGGFETFAEEISIRLANETFDVTVICQDGNPKLDFYNKVQLRYSRFSKEKNPVKFYYDSLKMALGNYDITVVCGVGGALFYPFLKKSKGRIITHVDGREELRGKYSGQKKLYVRMAQTFAAKYSDHIVADSNAVKRHWQTKYALSENKISAIAFGAPNNISSDDTILSNIGLNRKTYYLVVCRMVPENNLEMILRGFISSESKSKLVLVGTLAGEYGEQLKKYSSEQIMFIGSVYDKRKLFSLRTNCKAYLHGHSVGGTNPSLLESMAAGNVCICHDNEYNRETTDGEMIYFHNAEVLSEKIKEVENMDDAATKQFVSKGMMRISSSYNWEKITQQYVKLFYSFKIR